MQCVVHVSVCAWNVCIGMHVCGCVHTVVHDVYIVCIYVYMLYV